MNALKTYYRVKREEADKAFQEELTENDAQLFIQNKCYPHDKFRIIGECELIESDGVMMKKVWVVTMWQDDEEGSGHSYVWKVCATKERAHEYASRHPLWTEVEEYEVEE